MSGALLAYALFSAYAFVQFPYDNACESEEQGAAGEYTGLTFKNGTAAPDITVTQDTFVTYCGQNWRQFDGFPFPPTERVQPEGKEWMGDSQATLANMYGWTCLITVIVFLVTFFGGNIFNFFASWFQGVYQGAFLICLSDVVTHNAMWSN